MASGCVSGDLSRRSCRSCDVVETPEKAIANFGTPKTIRVDNGPEFVSQELDLGTYMRGVILNFSRPGKPTDNAFIETMNGKFRADCLNANWFMSLSEARRQCESWRRDYSEVRSHSSISNKAPIKLHLPAGQTGQPAVR